MCDLQPDWAMPRSYLSSLPFRLTSLSLLVLAPSQMWPGLPIWRSTSGQLVQVLAVATAYFVLALFPLAADKRVGLGNHLLLGTVWLAPLSAAFLALLLVDPLTSPYSRGMLLLSSGMSGILLLIEFLIDRFRAPFTGFLGSAAAIVFVVGVPSGPEEGLPVATERIRTNRHVVRASHYPELASSIPGGGIGRIGEDILLVTGEGDFSRLSLSGDTLRREPMRLRAPLNREEFLAGIGEAIGSERDSFRVSGLFAQPAGEGTRVVVSHHYWHPEEACFAIRFSEVSLSSGDEGAGQGSSGAQHWRTLHETDPCVPIREQGNALGGEGIYI